MANDKRVWLTTYVSHLAEHYHKEGSVDLLEGTQRKFIDSLEATLTSWKLLHGHLRALFHLFPGQLPYNTRLDETTKSLLMADGLTSLSSDKLAELSLNPTALLDLHYCMEQHRSDMWTIKHDGPLKPYKQFCL